MKSDGSDIRRPWWHPRSIKGAITKGNRKGDVAVRVAAPVTTGSIIAWLLEMDLDKVSMQMGQSKIMITITVGIVILFLLRMRDLSQIGRELVEQQKFTVEAINRMTQIVENDVTRIDGVLEDHGQRIQRLENK